MKEIIEYLLAAIIIISFIPIYDMINYTILTPQKAANVQPGQLLYISNGVLNAVSYAYNQGNLSEIVDLSSLLYKYLGAALNYYGIHVKLISYGIYKIYKTPSTFNILTLIKGNLTLILVYSDLSISTVKITQYSTIFPNGTLLYQYFPSTTNIIALAAILENGVARYIDYWISSSVYKAYIYNYNGNVYLAIPSTYPQPFTYTLSTTTSIYNVVNTTLVYYSNNVGKIYRANSYNYWINLTWKPSGTGSGYRSYISYYYVSWYHGINSINGNNYYIFSLERYLKEAIYYEKFSSSGTVNYSLLTGTKSYMSSISFPIYNLIFVLIKDSLGNTYVAIYYPYSLDFGETIPSNWLTKVVTYNIRLGLVNYEVYVTIWSKST